MSLRISAIAVGALALLIVPPPAKAGPPERLKWAELSKVVGNTVSIAMPGSVVISGKATAVEADALVVEVTKTSDKSAWPKGVTRIPRARLRVLEMQSKTRRYRILGAAVGSVAGLGGGVAAYIGINGGILNDNNPGKAAAALIGIWAAGTAGGYLIGNSADKRSTTIEILPD